MDCGDRAQQENPGVQVQDDVVLAENGKHFFNGHFRRKNIRFLGTVTTFFNKCTVHSALFEIRNVSGRKTSKSEKRSEPYSEWGSRVIHP